jgi:hypothetical protein
MEIVQETCTELEDLLLDIDYIKLASSIHMLLVEWCYQYKEIKTSKERELDKKEKICQFLNLSSSSDKTI